MSTFTETPTRIRPTDGAGGDLDAPWLVVVLNDDHNTFEGVAFALADVLPGVGFDQGMAFANRIHSTGRSRLVGAPRAGRALLVAARGSRSHDGAARASVGASPFRPW